jgi:hypothetical protein
MDRLFEALRRNPDVVALAVLCLMLGIGRQTLTCGRLSPFENGRVRIQWDCAKPSTDALDNLRAQIQDLLPDPPEVPSLPDFDR